MADDIDDMDIYRLGVKLCLTWDREERTPVIAYAAASYAAKVKMQTAEWPVHATEEIACPAIANAWAQVTSSYDEQHQQQEQIVVVTTTMATIKVFAIDNIGENKARHTYMLHYRKALTAISAVMEALRAKELQERAVIIAQAWKTFLDERTALEAFLDERAALEERTPNDEDQQLSPASSTALQRTQQQQQQQQQTSVIRESEAYVSSTKSLIPKPSLLAQEKSSEKPPTSPSVIDRRSTPSASSEAFTPCADMQQVELVGTLSVGASESATVHNEKDGSCGATHVEKSTLLVNIEDTPDSNMPAKVLYSNDSTASVAMHADHSLKRDLKRKRPRSPSELSRSRMNSEKKTQKPVTATANSSADAQALQEFKEARAASSAVTRSKNTRNFKYRKKQKHLPRARAARVPLAAPITPSYPRRTRGEECDEVAFFVTSLTSLLS